tara:strand:+ start:7044 stop:8048 length:1005 start_codon:yes stop_codon:yes gene_type:complete
MAKQKQNSGTITISNGYRSGRLNPNKPGELLGYFYSHPDRNGLPPRTDKPVQRYPIYSAGEVQVDMSYHVLGACPGRRDVFVGRDGNLWKFPKICLKKQVGPVRPLSREGRHIWADDVARQFIDSITPAFGQHAAAEAQIRYRKIVRTLVNARLLDAASLGLDKSSSDYAKAICSEWTESDLLQPRYASVQHALLVSLVLALDSNKAAELIELASFLQFKIPIVSRSAALGIYQQGCLLLSRLCPPWWNRGYTMDWDGFGDIDRIFRAQYARTMNEAMDRSIPLERMTLGGMNGIANTVGVGETERAREGVPVWGETEETTVEPELSAAVDTPT